MSARILRSALLAEMLVLFVLIVSPSPSPSPAGGQAMSDPDPSTQLFITEVFVTFDDSLCAGNDTITIRGVNFLPGDLLVILGDLGELI